MVLPECNVRLPRTAKKALYGTGFIGSANIINKYNYEYSYQEKETGSAGQNR